MCSPCSGCGYCLLLCLCLRFAADAVALAANAKLSKEQEQLEKLFSLCRHGKYTEIEEVRCGRPHCRLACLRATQGPQPVPSPPLLVVWAS